MNIITKEKYGKAVIAGIELAIQPTGGGRSMAQVLLSCYNGQEFQLDVAGLNNLDRSNFEIAMVIIHGRYDTGIEPHSMVKDGSKIFRELWEQWNWLKVDERGKRECPTCEGYGVVALSATDTEETCTRFHGSGRICRCS